MSHVPPKPATEAKPAAPKKKSGGTLRVILILVMLVMLGLLGWDRYARAAAATAFDKVVKWVEQDMEEYAPKDVQKLLGRQPDRGLEDKKDYALETYSWPRGVLVKSYFVKVIYRKDGDQVLLHEVVHNVEPEQNDLPNPPVEATTPPTGGELEPPPTGSGEEGSKEEPAPSDDEPSTTDPPAEEPPANEEPGDDASGESDPAEEAAATE